MADVLLARKGRDGYLSRKHVSGMVDDVCQGVPLRHGVGPFGRELQQSCEFMLGWLDDDAVISAFTTADKDVLAAAGKRLCGAKGMDICRNRKGQWTSDIRSPFALSPKSAPADAEL
jgi:hypothetical protein